MKVLLTGVTGFIGSHVARLAVGDGHEVHAVIREGANLQRIADIVQALRVVPSDLQPCESIDAHLERIRPDLCIHLAWHVVPGEYLSSPQNIPFVSASLHLASRLASLGCRRFVGIGTCFEYDTSLGYLAESSPTKPSNLYAASKLSVQLVLEHLGVASGMGVAWARLFYQYGPWEDERRLVPSVICSLLRSDVAELTEGEQIRDYLHVEDVASAIWEIARSDLTGPVNVGSGKPVTVREIVTTIGTILNRTELLAIGSLAYKPSDPMFICASNTHLKKNTSWIPRYDMESGLSQTIEWWQRQLMIR